MRLLRNLFLLSLISKLALSAGPLRADDSVSVSSKTFTESYILAEIIAERLEDYVSVERKLGLGGSGILFEALQGGKIDLYPEYTGTIAEALLKEPKLRSIENIRKRIHKLGLVVSSPLGFNNTYALAMRKEQADKLGIESMSDLGNHPDLRVGVSYEFLKRADGWEALSKSYDYQMKNVKGMEHSLAYEALDSAAIDVIDVYTTDAKLKKFNLKVLDDDLDFFPRYDAVILARADFVARHPEAWASLIELEGQITEEDMIKLNSLVDLEGASFRSVAQNFWSAENEILKRASLPWAALWTRSKEHLFLVFYSLLAAIFIGVPLGIWAAHSRPASQIIISGSGLIQTMPSLALLCFFIPFLGIGVVPALAALFLYALLPIVRATYAGLQSIDHEFLEISQVVGMRPMQSLLKIELPLASVHILNGIKTSLVINVGTATLAAFIGAGGLGSFIVTGLALNDVRTILLGAIPAALLALVLQYGFDLLDKVLIPKGLRLSQGSVKN